MFKRFFGRSGPETREAEPETRTALQELLDLRLAQAAAANMGDAGTLAAAEIAAGLWERAMAGGESDRLEAWQLGMIGRSLVVRGESVWLARGGLATPAADWDIYSTGVDPSSWTYRLTLQGPSGSLPVYAAYAEVLHYRIRVDHKTPWRGRSPWAVCPSTANLAAAIEQSLTYEMGGPVGGVLPVPDLNGAQGIQDGLPTMRGRVLLGETMGEGWEVGQGRAPRGHEWQPVRIGPNPPESETGLRENTQSALLAAAGVPVEIVNGGGGGDTREGWRRFLFSTISPVGKIVAAETARVMGGSGRIDWSELAASDLQARARAYAGLVQAGMSAEDARRICGFEQHG